MRKFRSGRDLEDEIFNRHSSGDKLVEEFREKKANFSADVIALIKGSSPLPDTRIGRSLFSMVKIELERLGVDPAGLIFATAVDTKVDLRHFADGVFYLPSVHRFPVTVDLFNLGPHDMLALEDLWASVFSKRDYSVFDQQSDLFRWKRGLSVWMKEHQIPNASFVYQDLGKFRRRISRVSEKTFPATIPEDLRIYADRGRPKNHFILTYLHVGTHQRRREFARMIAGYLASKAPR